MSERWGNSKEQEHRILATINDLVFRLKGTAYEKEAFELLEDAQHLANSRKTVYDDLTLILEYVQYLCRGKQPEELKENIEKIRRERVTWEENKAWKQYTKRKNRQ